MKTLLQFFNASERLEQGKYPDEQLLVVANTETFIERFDIEDLLLYYFESSTYDDTERFIVSIENIMNESGIQWEWASGVIPECNGMMMTWWV